jgi:hypothetical protein
LTTLGSTGYIYSVNSRSHPPAAIGRTGRSVGNDCDGKVVFRAPQTLRCDGHFGRTIVSVDVTETRNKPPLDDRSGGPRLSSMHERLVFSADSIPGLLVSRPAPFLRRLLSPPRSGALDTLLPYGRLRAAKGIQFPIIQGGRIPQASPGQGPRHPRHEDLRRKRWRTGSNDSNRSSTCWASARSTPSPLAFVASPSSTKRRT